MKKDLTPKKVQKLQLSRETLRDLTAMDLQTAAGGAATQTSTMC